MRNNLSHIFRIQEFLENINYPGAYRIAREIVDFLDSQNYISEKEILDRLKKQEPWEYIKGHANFCGIDFKVTKDTLIPRIETEQLVSHCIGIIGKGDFKNIIDVGTGSGCIIISTKHLLPENQKLSCYATDISNEALLVAKENEKKITKKEEINWINTNLIENIPKLKGDSILIANLPYIPTKIYSSLDKSVLDYEPKTALDGGKDGLDKYRELFKQMIKSKIDIKSLFIETETDIFKETGQLIKKFFPESKMSGIKDCFNKDRFFLVTQLQLT